MIACLADARYLAQTGRPAAATARLRLILAVEPENEEAWLWFAALQSDLAARRDALLRVVALNPHNVQALRGLGRSLSRQAPPYSLWNRRYPNRSAQPGRAVARAEPIVSASAATAAETVATSAPGVSLFSTLLVTACFTGALALGLEVGRRIIEPLTAMLQTALPQVLARFL